MRTLIDDFLPQVRPGYISFFSAHRAIKFTYLTAYVRQFAAFCLKSALAVRTVKLIHLLDSHVYNLHALSPSFLIKQPEEPSVQVVISVLAAWDREFDSHVIIGNPFRHTFQNITGKFLVRFLGHSFDHVHPIRVKQSCHRAFSNRIIDVICPARRYQFGPTARKPIQHGIRFSPYRIL